jgi:hypothetical protein
MRNGRASRRPDVPHETYRTYARVTRYASRVDSNQSEIVSAFRDLMCSVKHLHTAGRGIPDILVGFGGFTALCEIKTEKGKLNKVQEEWRKDWTGGVYTVRNFDDVVRIHRMMMRWHYAVTKLSLEEVRGKA